MLQGGRNRFQTRLRPLKPAWTTPGSSSAVQFGSLSFDRPADHPRHDLPLEEQEQDERRNRDDEHIGEEQVPLGTELAHEAVQRELHGYVLLAREEVERGGEVV